MKYLEIILPSRFQHTWYKPSLFGWRMFVYRRLENFLNWYNRDCKLRRKYNMSLLWMEYKWPEFKKDWKVSHNRLELFTNTFLNWAFKGPYHPYKITLWQTDVQSNGQKLTTMYISGLSKGGRVINASLWAKELKIGGVAWKLKKAPKGVLFTNKQVKNARQSYLRWKKKYESTSSKA